MDTKIDSSFSPIDVRLPRAVIEQAVDGELPYDFFKQFTVNVPILPDVELGQKLEVYLHLTGAGTIFFSTSIDQQMLDNGRMTSQQSWSFSGRITDVSLWYELTRPDGDEFEARRRVYSVLSS